MKRALPFVFPLSLVACGGAAPSPTPRAPESAPPCVEPQKIEPRGAKPTASESGVVRLRVKPLGVARVSVEAEYKVDLSKISGFRIDADPKSVHKLEATDASGPLPLNITAEGSAALVTPSRRIASPMRVSYTLDVDSEPRAMSTKTVAQDDRFWGRGASLFLTPIGTNDSARVFVVVDGDDIKAAQAASSFGVGRVRESKIPLSIISEIIVVAGSLGGSVIDSPSEGHDEAAWLGSTAFDPRPVAGELALLRTLTGETLNQHLEAPFSYLFAVTPRANGNVSMKPTIHGLTFHIGPGEPWSSSLRLSATQYFFQRWIGAQVVVADKAHEAEGIWFSRGVSRFIAARTLTRAGFMKPTELREEVENEEQAALASPVAGKSNSDLAAMGTPESRSVLAARGFLYAAHVDAFVRDKSKGARGIEHVLRKLLSVKADGRFLTKAQWLDAVASEAGARDDEAFDSIIRDGKVPTLTAKTFGTCLTPQIGTYSHWETGYDSVASFTSGKVEGVEPNGPAATAGMKDGEYIDGATLKNERGTTTNAVTLVREGKSVTLAYPVKENKARGQRWTAGKSDDCWK